MLIISFKLGITASLLIIVICVLKKN